MTARFIRLLLGYANIAMSLRKVFILIGSVSAVEILLVSYFGTYSLCSEQASCVNLLHSAFFFGMPWAMYLIFEGIFFVLRKIPVDVWFRYTLVVIPLSMLLIFLAPQYSSDFLLPIEKGTVAATTSLLYALGSLAILGYEWSRRDR